jgi:hypothetical protein
MKYPEILLICLGIILVPVMNAQETYDFVVAKDGTGDHHYLI